MNSMKVPGFSAERSLYNPGQHYVMTATLAGTNSSATVYPQRATGPYGPIGLPGQGCDAACWHICMSFGGGVRCMENCRSTCTNSSLGIRF